MTSTPTADPVATRPWSSRTLRVNNERVLLERLRLEGPASRAHLARVTGLSKPTVSAALGNLDRAGLVRETGEMTVASGRGRSAVLYEADPTAGYVIAVDINRPLIRVALADLDGTVRGRRELPTVVGPQHTDPAAAADAIVAAAGRISREMVAEAGLEWDRVVHAVVGTPGVFDPATDAVRYAGTLPGWGQNGVVERLRRELGTGLAVHNDANLAALGEYTYGAGRGCKLLVYLMVGTGVGAGIVVEGRVFGGAHGAAGEVGYLPFPPGQGGGHAGRGDQDIDRADAGPGHPPACEPADAEAPHTAFLQRGTLDAAAGGSAVTAMAAAAGTRNAHDPDAVFDAARSGDPAALSAVRAEAGRLAHAVASIAAMLDPELVVLGGEIGAHADLLLDPLYDVLESLTPLRPPVVAAALGRDAVLLGAITTALSTAREYVFERRL
ncbi:ROK family transcriptional regulator [Actinospica durhamensis]|uniref:ROK family transcriptional regulator n=1 Tax=Actinospica durhamensis TaxID=1508375 RepID=A0A941ERG5_9ACTN|nr:ROK family transcriptional regulator [Actinospica durhamensis]MBR7836110.1 ROK family transcriptional regulator [Actinospica durhamensis]